MTRTELASVALKVLGLAAVASALGLTVVVHSSAGVVYEFAYPRAVPLLLGGIALVRCTQPVVHRMFPGDPDGHPDQRHERRLFRVAASVLGLYLVAAGIPDVLGAWRPLLAKITQVQGLREALFHREAVGLWAAALPALYGLFLILFPRVVTRFAYGAGRERRSADAPATGSPVVPDGSADAGGGC